MLVGRSGELARLDALAASAQAGAGGRLVLVGDPGMGKSALLGAAERHARRRGLRVLRVCAAPGQAVLESSLLEDLLRQESGAQCVRTIADPAQPAERIALELLLRLTRAGPVLLTIDDAHLADITSLRALRTAVERLAPSPLAFAIATRPHTPTRALLTGWPHLVLGPLDRDAAKAVLRAALGPSEDSPILDQVAAALHDHPLLLTRAGDLLTTDQIAGRTPLPDPVPVPPALAAEWVQTLDGLSGPTRATLLDLAVAGDRLDLLTSMTAALGLLPVALDEASGTGLLIEGPDGTRRLRTPALRDVVLALAPPAQVRAAHRRAADAATRLDLPAGIVVDHLIASVNTADTSTATQVAEQATRAEAHDQFEVAARAWEAAAHMTTAPSDRVGFALSAARVAFSFGLPASEALLQVITTNYLTPQTQAQVAGMRAESRMDIDPQSALPAIWASVERAEVTAPETVSLLLMDAAGIAWELGEAEDGLRAAQRYAQLVQDGRALDQGRIDPPWTATALLAAGLFQAGQVARAMPLRQAALKASATLDARAVELPMLMAVVGLDDILLDISPGATDRLLVAAERAGQDSQLIPCLYGIQGWRARARGDWPTAWAYLRAGRPRAEAAGLTQPWLGMTALAVELAALCGEDEVLQVDARRLREVGARCADRRRLATLDRALGLRALREGNLSDAVAWLAAAADVRFLGRGLRDAVLPARVDLIEALVRSGDYAEAAGRYAELHPLLTAMGDPLATALDERAAALVTGGEEAEDHYRAALAAHALSGEPFEQARTHMLLGEHLRRNRQRSHARAHLQSAVHAFDGLGATPWSARAGQELRAAGGQPGGAGHETSGDISALTAQERAVALAVASGMSNREVAEALFLSTRTVEYHLGNVYRKLRVHGRGALARALDSAPAPSSSTSWR